MVVIEVVATMVGYVVGVRVVSGMEMVGKFDGAINGTVAATLGYRLGFRVVTEA
jgi:hypothetical protein